MDKQQQISGNLYYIKLETNLGVFYKIGFTTYQNINDRFNYNGSSDYTLIKEVLMFQYYSDAYLREQKLHKKYQDKKAFLKYSNETYLPLANNGQSELYYHDVLSLDKNFSKKESLFTKLRVHLAFFKNNPIGNSLILGFIIYFAWLAIIIFIKLFPFSLIFILFVYFITQSTNNIFKKFWEKNKIIATITFTIMISLVSIPFFEGNGHKYWRYQVEKDKKMRDKCAETASEPYDQCYENPPYSFYHPEPSYFCKFYHEKK